jgi:hypothetical protein
MRGIVVEPPYGLECKLYSHKPTKEGGEQGNLTKKRDRGRLVDRTYGLTYAVGVSETFARGRTPRRALPLP